MTPPPRARDDALTLEGFGVAFGEQVVLASIDAHVPSRGVTLLMGPMGSGKSTLLRTLAGLNDAQPSLRTWGRVIILGEPAKNQRRRRRDDDGIGSRRRVAIVQQKARFFMESVRENLASALPDRAALTRAEQTKRIQTLLQRSGLGDLEGRLEDEAVTLALWEQRSLAIVRGIAGAAPILLIDEPTSGLDEDDAYRVLDVIRHSGRDRCVVMITHNKKHAAHLGGYLLFLAGGRVLEAGMTSSFLEAPTTEAGRTFVRTGGCSVPTPGARIEELADHVAPPPSLPPQARATSDSIGPRAFRWIKPGHLGGLPRPGLMNPVDADLDGLVQLGVTALFTLEEDRTVPTPLLSQRGIRGLWFPIPDMKAPTLPDARNLCEQVRAMIEEGQVVAMHCKAGMGRTGTCLAAYLIYEGASSVDALENARRINPRWIQSDAQMRFLQDFATALRRDPPRGGA